MSGGVPTYLGIDLETTGLDPSRDRIIEIAVVILDADLVELSAWTSTVQLPLNILDPDSEAVQMHLVTGLLVRAGDSVTVSGWAVNLASAEEALLIRSNMLYPEPPILLGSSVHFDRAFLRHWMPHFEKSLHYRQIDARCFKRITPELPWDEALEPGEVEHRALPDIRRAIRACRQARQWLLRGGERKESPCEN